MFKKKLLNTLTPVRVVNQTVTSDEGNIKLLTFVLHLGSIAQ